MTTSTEDTATSDAAQDAAPDTTETNTSSTTETTSSTDASQTPATDAPQQFDATYVAKLRAEAAKYRNQANANADAARKLAEIEDAQKSETQRLTEARATAEKEASDARAEAMRLRVAVRHGISDEDAELFLTGHDEETLIRQAEALQAKAQKVTTTPTSPAAPLTPPPAPAPRADLSQGARGAKSTDPAASFAEFFKGQLNS